MTDEAVDAMACSTSVNLPASQHVHAGARTATRFVQRIVDAI